MSSPVKGSSTNPRFRWRGLTLQLFTLIVLPLIGLVLLLTFGGLNLHQQAMRTLVGERDERAARTAARSLDEQLNHRATVIRSLALQVSDDISNQNLDQILVASEFLLADFDQGIAFFARGGELLASLGDSILWENINPELDPGLINILIRDAPQTFSSFVHPTTGEPLLFVTASSFKGGPIVVGALSPAIIAHRTLADVFTPTDRAVAFLVDQDDQLLYQIGDFAVDEDPITHPGVVEALAGDSGATYIQVGSSEHVIAFSPVTQVGWALVIEEPWESVTSPQLRGTENAPLIMVPVLLIALLALWFGVRQIVQPLQALEARAASVAWGDYEAIENPVGGIEEIRRLQRELAHMANKVQSSQKGLRGYIGAITAGQEEERRRLARELHDETIQSLIGLNQRVQLALLSLNGDQTAETLNEIQTLTEQTIQNLRRITHALRPIFLEDLGLVPALDMLARETNRESGLHVQFNKMGNEERLPPVMELALYRMAQEGLNNIIRHAHANNAALELSYNPDNLVLAITDDGSGFIVPESPAEFVPSGHFGLLGLYERAELIGARLEIHSEPNEGTRLVFTLPRPHQENASQNSSFGNEVR